MGKKGLKLADDSQNKSNHVINFVWFQLFISVSCQMSGKFRLSSSKQVSLSSPVKKNK